MSGLYAYCVASVDTLPPPELEGLARRRVRALRIGELAVWVSDATGQPALELEAVAKHHEVVCSAAARGSVAPLRFGAWAAAESVLRERIETRRDEFERTLLALEGAVELGIRVIDPAGGLPSEDGEPSTERQPSSSEGRPGRAYMRRLSADRARRRARRVRQDELAERLAGRLGSLAREQRVQYLDEPEVVALAHLVRALDEDEYRNRIAAFADQEGGVLEIHVSGPWPPYSFACAT